MPRRLMISGAPVPPDGQQWCAVCVADWKRVLVEQVGINADWITKELAGTDADPPKVIAPALHQKMPPVEVGVTLAPVTKLGGTALVCWTHADALGTAQPPVPPAFGRNQLIQGMS